MINKLEYEIGGKEANWNQRPRDAANVTKYMARQMERDLNWQIVNLKVPIADLHDAPILYLAGNQPLDFSKDELAKLKAFVEQGGMLLGNADCGDRGFAKSFKDLGTSLFSHHEWRALKQDHPIYTRQQFLGKNWESKPNMLGLSNGVRELMLLVPDSDPAKAWQQQDDNAKEELFQLMADVFLYAVEGKDLRNKGSTYIVQADPKASVKKTIKVARLQMGDNPDPEPGGWRRLCAVMHNTEATNLEVKLIKPEALTKDFKVAHLTGTTTCKFNAERQSTLKAFVDGGGTLVIDAAGGNTLFSDSAKAALTSLFGDEANQLANVIPASDPIYNSTSKPVSQVTFRAFERNRVGSGMRKPQVRGIKLNGRWAVLLSEQDISAGLVGNSIDGVAGYSPQSATAIMTSLLLAVRNR